jgi:hypothetical protein
MIMATNLAGAGPYVVRLVQWGPHSYPVSIVNIFGADVSKTDEHVNISNGEFNVTLHPETEDRLERSKSDSTSTEEFCGEISYLNRKLDGLSVGKRVDVHVYSLSDYEAAYPGLMFQVVHGTPRRFHGPGDYSEEFKFGKFINRYRADKKRREESKARINKVRADMNISRRLSKEF